MNGDEAKECPRCVRFPGLWDHYKPPRSAQEIEEDRRADEKESNGFNWDEYTDGEADSDTLTGGEE
jgi:hypothetical protein